MNKLQIWRLLKFCREHELDPYLVDKMLTYNENKKYLESLVPDFNPESDMDYWRAAEEQYMAEHPLWHYLSCMAEGKTKSEDVGEVDREPPHFSLKGMVHVGFSLRHILAEKS